MSDELKRALLLFLLLFISALGFVIGWRLF